MAELSSALPRGPDGPCAMISPRHSARCFRNALSGLEGALCPLQDWKIRCLCILHDLLLGEKFNLHWVPRSLHSNQNAQRPTLSHELLEIVKKDEEHYFRNVMASKEFWFYFEFPHDSAFAASGDAIPERIK
jgi:hypothetical protein